MPRRICTSAWAEGEAKGEGEADSLLIREPESKTRSARWPAKPAPAKVEGKPNKETEKAKSSDKKIANKEKKGAKENQTQRLASDEAGKKEAKSD
ncbi:unnamed protein product [Nyctereutes procyonoides]|uniref:(raccoon dog) hypothetical protein n=1 Tax=Nyctereutes procyonoides TaxID=34880 RepID=A0A811YLZ2_NYCPR|nr:unnamed protein product [Nyctereutes procyonoides]